MKGPYRKLLDVNVAYKELRESKRLLLYGTCVRDEYPQIYEKYIENRVPLAVCMEEEQFNVVALKLASIASRVQLEDVSVLTVDGSPHCLQLHLAVEEVDKIVKGLPRKHLVIEEGKVWEIEPEVVRIARYLTKIARLTERS